MTVEKAIANKQVHYQPPTTNNWMVESFSEDFCKDQVEEGEDDTEALPFEMYNYAADEGGIIDIWLDHYCHNWIFNVEDRSWYRWNGTFWEKDKKRRFRRGFQDLLSLMNEDVKQWLEAAKRQSNSEAQRQAATYEYATKRTNARINSLESMAQDHKAINADQFNQGNLLNFPNGTLDLSSLTFREHCREDFLTVCLDYEYDSNQDCPLWQKTLREHRFHEGTHAPDETLILLYQELWGYSLTTDTKHETMIWQQGCSANGKSVVTKVLNALLGPLAQSVNFQTLGSSGNYDLANLPGKRVVFATEAEKGRSIEEALLKRLVSGELTSARPIYGQPFEFHPVAKIWWSMNDKPTIRDTSDGLWRRLKLIPFHRTFTLEERDPALASKLMEELPGILNWALEGLERLNTQGEFTESDVVSEQVNTYRTESNTIALWLQECTETTASSETAAKTLYQNYNQWCEQNGYTAETSTGFGKEMKRLTGHKRTSNGICYAVKIVKK